MQDIVKKERKIYIDAIKGLGIILVLLFHGNVNTGYLAYLSIGYMSMFFVASGYTYKPAKTLGEEIKKKGKRLFIPYIVYGLFSVALFSAMELIHGEWSNFFQRLAGLLYSRFFIYPNGPVEDSVAMLGLTGNPPLWFLTAMFSAIVLAYVLSKTRYKVLFVVIFVALSVALSFTHFLLPWSLDTAFIFALFIFFGMNRKYGIDNVWKFVIGFALFAVLAVYNSSVNISIREYGQHGVLSIFLFFILGVLQTECISYCLQKIERLWLTKVLAYLGRISLTIMCLHLPILTKLDPYFFRVMSGVPDQVVHLLLIAFTLGVCVLFAMFCNRYKSKFPLLKWL